MKNTEHGSPIRKLPKKILSGLLAFSLMISLVQPFAGLYATIMNDPSNTLTGANNNYVNATNSGTYSVNYIFSGSFDANDTLRIIATNGSGNTATGTYISLLGGESSGSVNIDFSTPPWTDGMISYDAIVYSGGVSTQVVASGITLTGTLDTLSPGITLSSSAPGTISGAIIVDAATSEALLGFSGSDILVTNGTTSGFTQTTSTGYSFTVTPTMSGMVTISVGTGMATDMAGNPSNASNILSYSYSGTDVTDPIINITSHASGATVTGSPVLSGTVTDIESSITSVVVGGVPATFGSGTFSHTLTGLAPGPNTIVVIATDSAGNTGSTSTVLYRAPLASNPQTTLSGASSAIIAFTTDITATGVVHYGVLSGALLLTTTGTNMGTSHSITLSGLSLDTTYYYAVLGEGGPESNTMQFHTPQVVGNDSSGAILALGAIYLSGGTSTGVTFNNSGTITLMSVTSSGSSLFFPYNGLTIIASGGGWDGILQAPEIRTPIGNLSLSGYAFTGTAYQVGNTNTSLFFSGQVATVNLKVNPSLSGQTLMVYRSSNGGTTYTQHTSCIVSGSDCIFTTDQPALFALALPSDTVPDTFSFTHVSNAEISTLYTSNPVTLSGFSSGTVISVSGGEYSINSGAFTTISGTVNPGESIRVRRTSSATYSSTVNVNLTVGSSSQVFTITTKSAPSSGGGGGVGPGGPSPGGGGGGGVMAVDVCLSGDYSGNYYDNSCIAPLILGDISNGACTGSFMIPGIIWNASDLKFRDIQWNWARSHIEQLAIRGIIDNAWYYQPDAGLTRAEFLKIVLGTTGCERPTTGLGNLPFRDVSSASWQAPYIALALEKGMIRRSTIFRPNDPITRAEAAKILVMTLGVTVNESNTIVFIDVSRSSDLAKYIDVAELRNIFSGQIANGKRIFRPHDNITRSEIAKVVVNTFGLK